MDLAEVNDLPKEAPEEVRKVAQLLIARYEKAGRDASGYVLVRRHESDLVPEEWAIADNFERNDPLIFKVANSQWCRRDGYTGTDTGLSGLGAALKAARTWKLKPDRWR